MYISTFKRGFILRGWILALGLFGLFGLFGGLTSCQKGNFIPQIENISLNKVEIVDENLHVEFLIKVNNPGKSKIKINLGELELQTGTGSHITRLESEQLYILNPGQNKLVLPLSFNKDILLKTSINMFLNPTVTLRLLGNLNYSHRLVKGKLRFNQDIPFDLNKILGSLLKNSF